MRKPPSSTKIFKALQRDAAWAASRFVFALCMPVVLKAARRERLSKICVEGIFEMADAPVCAFFFRARAGRVAGCRQASLRFEFAGDYVEAYAANLVHKRGTKLTLSLQPGAGAAHEPHLLAQVDGFFGAAVCRAASRFYFHENEHACVQRDQIDFDAVAANVLSEDSVPCGLEVGGGARLTEGAKLSA